MKYRGAALISLTAMGFAIAAHILCAELTHAWVRAIVVGAAAGVGSIAAMKLTKRWGWP